MSAQAPCLRLGASSTIGTHLIADLATDLRRYAPALRLHVREGSTDRLWSEFSAGDHDVILSEGSCGGDHQSELVACDALHVAMVPDHALVRSDVVGHDELAGQDMLALVEGHRLARDARAIAASSGAVLLEEFAGTSLDALRQMTGTGVGMTLLPGAYVRRRLRGQRDVVTRPLATGPSIDIRMMWRGSSERLPFFPALLDRVRACGSGL